MSVRGESRETKHHGALRVSAVMTVAAALVACTSGEGEGTHGLGTGEGGAGGVGTGAPSSGHGGDGGEGGGEAEVCEDTCPAPGGGVTFACKHRFMYGVNYAWQYFGGDFGGIAAWQQAGVSADAASHAARLADIHDHGGSVVRWWVFPDFRGDGIAFDASDNPTGLGGTAVADLHKALELAAQADVYLMPCLFSFDAFRPSGDVAGIWVPGITPMVVDAQKRAMLLENVVRPLARAAASSPHSERLLAWDVINEPEWAMTGPSPYGDDTYDPMGELAVVTHAQMETFVAEVIGVLREESSALVTVGGAAMKWAKAWSAVDVDFYQFHMYDWINAYWPYMDSPAEFGVDDRPVVMGEFPLQGLSGVSYGELVGDWYGNGYAGALGWHYEEATPEQLDAMKAFASTHACETRY
ncbi:hypothetical protein [Chondromyces apiculatus]|uniref:Mannan endo-1,4-beta-mannosidase n=1 Tax=Chondromyces apiculatus DSM 436 TaxID=1192034 RepID=A0A017TDC3_9BACT|nr:hypothetical protein [Chondromyces apiculatus]EYF07298.1 Mannan endo-1,4-beta-mannosidase precursor [Chondromyces apiculatus DSM 436]